MNFPHTRYWLWLSSLLMPTLSSAFWMPIAPSTVTKTTTLHMALGDISVTIEKPLGIILEESDNSSGVYVKEVNKNSNAYSVIAPGDVLKQVQQRDVSTSDFDSVMDSLLEAPSPVTITLGDGLGTLDMPKNVVKQLDSTDDAYFVDAVVRQAVREIRMDGRLGMLQSVEVVVGAGVPQPNRAMVRFFAIFSTDGVSTYSCNVSATGVRVSQDSETVKIVALSCAKDEGLGRTYDLIQEHDV